MSLTSPILSASSPAPAYTDSATTLAARLPSACTMGAEGAVFSVVGGVAGAGVASWAYAPDATSVASAVVAKSLRIMICLSSCVMFMRAAPGEPSQGAGRGISYLGTTCLGGFPFLYNRDGTSLRWRRCPQSCGVSQPFRQGRSHRGLLQFLTAMEARCETPTWRR